MEKDYRVTQILRALHRGYAGAFVLKGGTSLSKGCRLIERFSEDVDILIQPASGDSAKSRERLLNAMVEHVAHTLDVRWLQAREPGRGKRPHRADVLNCPRVARSGMIVPVEDRGVLLETGYAGGELPSKMLTLTPARPHADAPGRASARCSSASASTHACCEEHRALSTIVSRLGALLPRAPGTDRESVEWRVGRRLTSRRMPPRRKVRTGKARAGDAAEVLSIPDLGGLDDIGAAVLVIAAGQATELIPSV